MGKLYDFLILVKISKLKNHYLIVFYLQLFTIFALLTTKISLLVICHL